MTPYTKLVMKELERTDLSKEDRERWRMTLTLPQTLTLQDKIEKNNQYYSENKEQLDKKRSQKTTCEICGAIIQKTHISRHYKSKDCRIVRLEKINRIQERKKQLMKQENKELKQSLTDD